ncbi:MAG: hypothetical protein AB7F86_05360 [Bdellovibrionales bacterium]
MNYILGLSIVLSVLSFKSWGDVTSDAYITRLKGKIKSNIDESTVLRVTDVSMANTACATYQYGSGRPVRISECFPGPDPVASAMRHFQLDPNLFRTKGNRGSSVYTSPGYFIDELDTIDWLAIQSALSRGRGHRVEIPAGTGDYIVNQTIVVFGNTRVQWTPSASGRFSFVQFENLGGGTADLLGSVFSNLNPYSGYPTRMDDFDPSAENILMGNPHIDAGAQTGVLGLNAIGLARGLRSAWITGGILRNARFNMITFGGKAIQCEQGCQDLIVENLRIENSSFGIASSSFRDAEFDANLPVSMQGQLAQSLVLARRLTFDRVEVPLFSISDVLTASAGVAKLSEGDFVRSLEGADPKSYYKKQALLVEGFVAIDSGVLNFSKFSNSAPTILGDCVQVATDLPAGNTDFGYLYFRTSASKTLPIEASSIIYSHLGRNIYVSKGEVRNQSLSQSSSLFAGATGSNIRLKDITTRGRFKNLFSLVSNLNGLTNPAVAGINGFYAENIRHYGSVSVVVETEPMFQIRKSKTNACVRVSSPIHMQDLKFDNIGFEEAQKIVGDGVQQYLAETNRNTFSQYKSGVETRFSGLLRNLLPDQPLPTGTWPDFQTSSILAQGATFTNINYWAVPIMNNGHQPLYQALLGGRPVMIGGEHTNNCPLPPGQGLSVRRISGGLLCGRAYQPRPYGAPWPFDYCELTADSRCEDTP